jgi:hypothetical protein
MLSIRAPLLVILQHLRTSFAAVNKYSPYSSNVIAVIGVDTIYVELIKLSLFGG